MMAASSPEPQAPWHPPCYGALDSFSVIRTEAARLNHESGGQQQRQHLSPVCFSPEPVNTSALFPSSSLIYPSLPPAENRFSLGTVEAPPSFGGWPAATEPWCKPGRATGYPQGSAGPVNVSRHDATPKDQLDLTVLECKGDVVAAPSPVLCLLDYFNKYADLFETWEWEKMVDGVDSAEDYGAVPRRCLGDMQQRDFSCMIPYAAALHSELLIASNRNHRILQRLRNELLRDVRTAEDPTSDALVKGYYEQLEELVDIPKHVTFPPPSQEGLLVTDCAEALNDVGPILRRRQKRNAQSDVSDALGVAIAELSTAPGSRSPQDSIAHTAKTKGSGGPPVGVGGGAQRTSGEESTNAGKSTSTGAAPSVGLLGKSIPGKGPLPAAPKPSGATGPSLPPGKVSAVGAGGPTETKKPSVTLAPKKPMESSSATGKNAAEAAPVAGKKPLGATPAVIKKPAGASPVVAKKPLGANPVVVKKPLGANPVVVKKPLGANPAVVKKPLGANPVVVKKPLGASPVVVKKPLGASPVVVKKPLGVSPVVVKKPLGVSPVVVKKPGAPSPVMPKKPFEAKKPGAPAPVMPKKS